MHAAAAEGFGAGAVAAYERGRPGYVPAHIRSMLLEAGLSPATPPSAATAGSLPPALWPTLPVLELGAGTGKMSRPLVQALAAMAPAGSRLNVVLSDPAGMAAALQADGTLAGHTFLKARADDLPSLPDGSVSLVTAGQAFHWFAEPTSLAEIARVLAPGGAFAAVWNIWDMDKGGPWLRAFDALIGEYYPPTTPRQCTGAWRAALAACPLFQRPFRELHLPQEAAFEGDEEHFITYAFSLSEIARLPEEGKAAVAGRIRDLLRADGTLNRIDPASGAASIQSRCSPRSQWHARCKRLLVRQ